ncbi:hypothetical protein BDZ89DRAFT_1191095 [Hymenopellis radicata]|nr:hypothetical protein BDZ89DRAFT_1191095 [Hymenopellis radicata]
MATFAPDTVKHLWKTCLTPKDAKTLDSEWDKNVAARVTAWKTKDTPGSDVQLIWKAHVVEYITRIHSKTTTHGNTKGLNATPPPLPNTIPIFGPHFKLPTYLDQYKRKRQVLVIPETLFLKPLVVVVYPFYYPNADLEKCPRCGSSNTSWTDGGWTGAGPRHVHGEWVEERAMGYQLRCKACKANGTKPFCFALTNKDFWQNWEPLQIPRTLVTIPEYLEYC